MSAATRSSARNSFQDENGKESPGSRAQRPLPPPQAEKQLCLRAEFEPDVHISQAEAKVYVPLGSHVGHVKTARTGQNGANQRARDHVLPCSEEPKNISGRYSSPRPLMALSDASLLLKVRGSMNTLLSAVDSLVPRTLAKVPRKILGGLRHWDVQTCPSRKNDWSDWRPRDRVTRVSVPRVHFLRRGSGRRRWRAESGFLPENPCEESGGADVVRDAGDCVVRGSGCEVTDLCSCSCFRPNVAS